ESSRDFGVRCPNRVESTYLQNLRNCQDSPEPRIQCLFALCCPPYVTDFVMPVVLDTVDRMFGAGSRSNFFKELHERFKFELNPATAVVLVGFCFCVGASLLNLIVGCLLVSTPPFLLETLLDPIHFSGFLF